MFSPDSVPDNVVSMPHHLPPQSIEAEVAVLGGILFDPQAITRVVKILQPEDFYVTSHKDIYQAAVRLHNTGQPTDLIFVTSWLESHGILSQIGGRNKLASLFDSCVSALNVDALAELVREKARLRAVIKTANEMLRDAMDAPAMELKATDVIEMGQQKLLALRQSTQESRIKLLADIIPEVYAEIELANSGEDAIEVSVPTGFYDLDAVIGGLPFAALSVVGGRGGIGKSTWALDIGLRAAASGLTTAYFALEMSCSQMVKKTLSRLAAPFVPADLLFKRNALHQSHWNPLAQSCAEAMGLPFWLNDDPIITTSQIKAHLQDVVAQGGEVSLVIIDYVQLIEPMRRERGENRVQEIDSILKQLRAIAKQFNCAVLGLAQLKREVDSRSEKRPTKADFRESGGFEQEAAVMLGLYREDYYDKQTTQKGIFEVSVLKSRFSSETTVNLLFDERFGQFKNLAKSNY
ncbi:replicative DNA helicase [aff. Roholtiella sp. LEGE 12411]|uniref:replicative DNA helicase n=1 Tax=aff. Roholtiella sp. LEGE 12411 TaxID=1828822 RepID=UPI001881D5BE|nr:DnaB-like helicase C-terminal domain-containing protein [aff. Roholtiella sp. LEGE 12411]MBE9038181.1 AAA family ATPase [aff. Roholtiella sp. LEGE 12411]